MRPVIQVSGVRKTYGPTVAVDEVSFEVNDGEIFGLIGPNGAGKTTTMECIEGLRTPDMFSGTSPRQLGGSPLLVPFPGSSARPIQPYRTTLTPDSSTGPSA